MPNVRVYVELTIIMSKINPVQNVKLLVLIKYTLVNTLISDTDKFFYSISFY